MSQLNHNAAYIFDVDGLTVWEKLRNIRSFLRDRQKALAINEAMAIDAAKKYALLPDDDIEKIKYNIELPDSADLLDDCRNEIAFLIDFEQKLAIEAEKTRIPGKSDKEMYEINWHEEKIARLTLDIFAELTTTNSVNPNTLKSIIRCRPALDRIVGMGLLPAELKVPDYIEQNLLLSSTVTDNPKQLTLDVE